MNIIRVDANHAQHYGLPMTKKKPVIAYLKTLTFFFAFYPKRAFSCALWQSARNQSHSTDSRRQKLQVKSCLRCGLTPIEFQKLKGQNSHLKGVPPLRNACCYILPEFLSTFHLYRPKHSELSHSQATSIFQLSAVDTTYHVKITQKKPQTMIVLPANFSLTYIWSRDQRTTV